ncbi:ice-binding family protein [Reinekea sp.]|uniref:ice-binding family protein n=1 Tax=Reinekea sp. TaxID=1970455 RepID=UPI002A839984|nr:ice-binding family protein [Reinekea sp.]
MSNKWSAVFLCSLVVSATGALAEEAYSFDQFLFKDHSVWSAGALAVSAGATVSKAVGAGAAVEVGAWAETDSITSAAAVAIGAYAKTSDIIAAAAVEAGQGAVVSSISAGAAVTTGQGSVVGNSGGPYASVFSGAATAIGAGAFVGDIHAGAAVSIGTGAQSGSITAGASISGGVSTNSAAYTVSDRPEIVFTTGPDGITNITQAQAILSGLHPTSMGALASMAGAVFTPGIYQGTAATVPANSIVTFDAQGMEDPLWIMNLTAAMTVGAGSQFRIINADDGGAVIWNIGGALTLGAGSNFIGSAFINGAVVGATANVCGNLWSNAAVGIGSVTSELDGMNCDVDLSNLHINDGLAEYNSNIWQAPKTLGEFHDRVSAYTELLPEYPRRSVLKEWHRHSLSFLKYVHIQEPGRVREQEQEQEGEREATILADMKLSWWNKEKLERYIQCLEMVDMFAPDARMMTEHLAQGENWQCARR